MTFPTTVLDIDGPVDLAANPVFNVTAAQAVQLFIQNTSLRTDLFYAEQDTAPDRAARNHILASGDALIIVVGGPGNTEHAWVYAEAGATGTLAVSPVPNL